jgi:DNA polymerase I
MILTASPNAYRLFHEGIKTFAEMEARGMRIDVPYLDRTIDLVEQRIHNLEERLRGHSIYEVWRNAHGAATNLNSRTQLGDVLFNRLGYKGDYTENTADNEDEDDRRFSTDESALERLDLGFVKGYLKRSKLMKLNGTYLKGIREETVDEYVHFFLNLHLVLTFRSSADSPNIQNVPVRDKEIMNLIRRAFIAPDGYYLVELDYSQLEVCIAACYHKDPTMLKYIAEGYDMHRDMAAVIFKVKVPAEGDAYYEEFQRLRQQVKALFVFAQFYGDYYASCADAIWDAIRRHKLLGPDGRSMFEHLKKMGIGDLGPVDRDDPASRDPDKGTFCRHIYDIQEDFWGKRFPVYYDWRNEWVAKYKRLGYMRTLTDFIIKGIYSRNFIFNAPVQGSAFHCLLRSVIRINEEVRKRRMKSKPVSQIHDSALAYVWHTEYEDFLYMARGIMVDELRKEWPWIITPLKIGIEAAPLGGSWADKKKVKLAA